MRISDILKPSFISLKSEVPSKEDALTAMVELLAKGGAVLDSAKVTTMIFEREKIMSTGIGKGFAVPHAKTDAVKETGASLMILKKSVDYQALDGLPVRIIFMLVGKENAVGTHLRLLSRISRLMNNDDFRERLLNAKSEQEIWDLINDEETQKLDG